MSERSRRNANSGRTVRAARGAAALGAALTVLAGSAEAQSLRGSRASVERMFYFAQGNGLSFRRTPEVILADAGRGRLVPLGGSLDYELSGGVGWPYVTAETRRFVELFAKQYAAICQQPLVITSASRPLSRQPRNANRQSVHPAGIAVDLRRPSAGPCLTWTRAALLELERRGMIEAIEERRPVHFHVAVLRAPGRALQLPALKVASMDPAARRGQWLAVREAYFAAASTVADLGDSEGGAAPTAPGAVSAAGLAGAASLGGRTGLAPSRWTLAPFEAARRPVRMAGAIVTESAGDVAPAPARSAAPARTASVVAVSTPKSRGRSYRVRPGDTLWDIARRHGTKVDVLLAENGLRRGARLRPGDVLQLPDGRSR